LIQSQQVGLVLQDGKGGLEIGHLHAVGEQPAALGDVPRQQVVRLGLDALLEQGVGPADVLA
jgi:hypothetical protein